MNERRSNWKDDFADSIQQGERRRALTDRLNDIRRQIDDLPRTKSNQSEYDQLQASKREIVAQLATL